MKPTIYCLTCKQMIEVKKIVAKCERETILALMCGHERHIRMDEETRIL